MTTTPLPSNPAQNLTFLCEQLPEYFRLAQVSTGLIHDRRGQTPFSFQMLEVNWGPDWVNSAVSLNLDSGFLEVGDGEGQGAAFRTVSGYCRDSSVVLVLTVDPDREWHRTCAVTLSDRKGRVPLHLGLSSTLDVAALDALMTALTAWQVGNVSPQRGWA